MYCKKVPDSTCPIVNIEIEWRVVSRRFQIDHCNLLHCTSLMQNANFTSLYLLKKTFHLSPAYCTKCNAFFWLNSITSAQHPHDFITFSLSLFRIVFRLLLLFYVTLLSLRLLMHYGKHSVEMREKKG